MILQRIYSLVVLGVAIIIVSNSLYAQEKPQKICHKLYVKGVQQYGMLDYKGAEKTLEKAKKLCLYNDQISVDMKISIAEQLSFTKIAVGKPLEAEALFVFIIGLDPNYEIDEENKSPKLMQAFYNAKKRTAVSSTNNQPKENKQEQNKNKQKKQRHKALKSQNIEQSTKKSETKHTHTNKNRFETTAEIGGLMLFGKDISNFGGGIIFSSSFAYNFFHYYFSGISISYNIHPISSIESKQLLNVLTTSAIGGVQIKSKNLKTQGGIELGAGFFGLDGINDKTGFYYGVFVCIQFSLPKNFSIGIKPSLAQITDSNSNNSTMASIRVLFSYEW